MGTVNLEAKEHTKVEADSIATFLGFLRWTGSWVRDFTVGAIERLFGV